MPTDLTNTVRSLLKRSIGKRCSEILVGPAGFHVDIGDGLKDGGGVGELSLWVKCGVLVNNKRTRFFECSPFPGKAVEVTLRQLLKGKTISDADLDSTKNAVRLLIEDFYLFTAY